MTHPPMDTGCTLADAEWLDLLRLLGLPAAARPMFAPHQAVLLRRVPQGRTLFHQGSATGLAHVVRSGSFKTCRHGEDGYEQVLGFAWRQDVLGLDGLFDGHHAHAAQALEDAQVYTLAVTELQALGSDGGPVLLALSRQLGHANDVADILSAVSAEARLGRFLLRLSDRMRACGLSPTRLRLSMNRRDIGSHLGLAHETVSRTLGLLATEGCIEVKGRDITLRDREALARLAQSTRSPVERRRADVPVPAGAAWGITRHALRHAAARPVPVAA